MSNTEPKFQASSRYAAAICTWGSREQERVFLSLLNNNNNNNDLLKYCKRIQYIARRQYFT